MAVRIFPERVSGKTDGNTNTVADTFHLAPWQADDLRIPLREKPVQEALVRREAAHQEPIIFLCLDDSLADKDKGSKHLQAEDWHFDHVNALPNQPAFAKGFVYVMLRLTVGEVSFTIDRRLYLRASDDGLPRFFVQDSGKSS